VSGVAGDGGDGSSGTPRAEGPVTPEREALLRHVAELLAYTAHYSSARLDRLLLSLREGALTGLILGGLGLFGLATAIICMVLLLEGFAGGLSVALDGALWGGQLIVGGGILLLMGVTGVIVLAIVNAKLRHARVEKYEKLKRNERARLGRDVDSAARAAQ
jgi:hypothetical protein